MSMGKSMVSPDPDLPGYFYYSINGEGSDISYPSKEAAEKAALGHFNSEDNHGKRIRKCLSLLREISFSTLLNLVRRFK